MPYRGGDCFSEETPLNRRSLRPAARRPSSVLFARIKAEARACFDKARGSHDWDHTERVLRLCLRIGRKEKADLTVLEFAAVLHDIGRADEDRTNGRVCHAEAGARRAGAILEKHGLAAETIARVVHCIETHRYRKALRPETIEARVLFDADKLDSIGAVGIGRAFLFAGEVGARLHDQDIVVEKTRPYTRDDTAYREYLVKLRHLKDRLTTTEGKRIARERHAFMKAFFARLHKETDGIL